MGGITQQLFGGSKEKSSSSSNNQAFGQIKDAFSGNIGTGNNAFSTIANLLGVGNGDSSGAFKNYLNSSGYKALMEGGQKAITGSAAAKGLLNSGSTAKALTSFGQDLAGTKFKEYMDQLGSLFSGGLQSGNLIAQAGQQSQSKGSGSSSTGIVNSLFG